MNPESILFMRHLDGNWIVGEGPFEHRSEPPMDQTAFYLPDFFLKDLSPWWVPEKSWWATTIELKARFPDLNTPANHSLSWDWTEPSKDGFFHEIEALLKELADGDFRKAVPIVMAQAERLPTLPERMALWARAFNYPARLIAYGGWWGKEGLFGLTPEYLFFHQENWIETMALAGTAPNPGPNLLESSKDCREHEWVVSDIRQQLARFGKVHSTPTREWPVGRIKHLRTDLAVEARASFMELVDALHPTPALGGFPRLRGREWLKSAAFAEERRRFGAPFGVQIPGEFGLCGVAIRNIQWHEGRVWQGSGCGVVEGSEPEREWNELTLKRQVVRDQLGIL